MADDPSTPPVPDLAKAIEGLLNRHGDATGALRVLLAENHTHRETIRDLKAKVPGEADVVLKGDDAKRWNLYRELGEPGEIKKTLKAAEDNAAEVGKFRRAELYDEAATLAKFNTKAFRRLAEADGLAVEIQADKKGERVPHVKGVDDKGQETLMPLTEYAETRWAEFLPSLQGGERKEPPRPNGTPPPRKTSGPPPDREGGLDPIHKETLAHGNYSAL